MTFASERLTQNQADLAAQMDEERTKQQALQTSRFKFEPKQIMHDLNRHIVGQKEVMQEIGKMLSVVKADFADPQKPLSVTLMLGPTGVGKTETVRLISQAIYGHADAFCRIDMNTLAQAHYAAALTGAPPGYVGSKEGHTLFDIDAIQGSFSKPGIVLFDEIEKASDEVIRALLNVLDTGYLRLTAGTKSIDFRNSMIFMTSNLGAKQSQLRLQKLGRLPKSIQKLAHRFKMDDVALTQHALRQKFDPEFLNRIDRILHYHTIGQDAVVKILMLEIEKLNERLGKQGRRIVVESSAMHYLANAYDQHYGARGLARRIRTWVEPILAQHFMSHPMHRTVELHYQQQLIIRPVLA